MALTVKAREAAGVTILEFNGKILVGESSHQLNTTVRE